MSIFLIGRERERERERKIDLYVKFGRKRGKNE